MGVGGCGGIYDLRTEADRGSRSLGHSSTKITETYNERIRNDKAMEEVARALERRPIEVLANL